QVDEQVVGEQRDQDLEDQGPLADSPRLAPPRQLVDPRDDEAGRQESHQYRENRAEPQEVGPEFTTQERLLLVREPPLQGDHQERPEHDEGRGDQTSRSYQRETRCAANFSPPSSPLDVDLTRGGLPVKGVGSSSR